jgi:hypothetical protein
MMNEGRSVYYRDENIMVEVIEQQLHQAKVRYAMGGFLVEEWLTDEDYEEIEVFEEIE